jgi:hypothetical protein
MKMRAIQGENASLLFLLCPQQFCALSPALLPYHSHRTVTPFEEGRIYVGLYICFFSQCGTVPGVSALPALIFVIYNV